MHNRFWCLVLGALLSATAFAGNSNNSTVGSENAQRLVSLMFIQYDKQNAQRLEAIKNSLRSMVQYETANLDPGNSLWNPKHPSWKDMESRINQDMEKFWSAIINTSMGARPSEQNALAHDYDNLIGANGIQYLLDFYQSPVGKQYFQFSEEIEKVEKSCSQKMQEMAANKERLTDIFKPPTPLLKKRYDLLHLAMPFRIIQAKFDADKQAKRDISGYGAVSVFYSSCTILQGEQLDGIGDKYATDSPIFQQYVDNNYSKQEMALYAASSERIMKSFGAEIMGMATNYQREWKKAYTEFKAVSE